METSLCLAGTENQQSDGKHDVCNASCAAVEASSCFLMFRSLQKVVENITSSLLVPYLKKKVCMSGGQEVKIRRSNRRDVLIQNYSDWDSQTK